MKQTKYVKVIDNTLYSNNERNKMIGGLYEVHNIDYFDSTVSVYNKDKSDWFFFRFSDVVEVTKEEYEASRDTLVGTEVEVKIAGKTYKAVIKSDE